MVVAQAQNGDSPAGGERHENIAVVAADDPDVVFDSIVGLEPKARRMFANFLAIVEELS